MNNKVSVLTESFMHMLTTTAPRTDTFANSLEKLQHFAQPDFSFQNQADSGLCKKFIPVSSNSLLNLPSNTIFFLVHISSSSACGFPYHLLTKSYQIFQSSGTLQSAFMQHHSDSCYLILEFLQKSWIKNKLLRIFFHLIHKFPYQLFNLKEIF